MESGGHEIIMVLKNIWNVTKMVVELFLFSSKLSLNLSKLIPVWSLNASILNKVIVTIDSLNEWTTLVRPFKYSTFPMHKHSTHICNF